MGIGQNIKTFLSLVKVLFFVEIIFTGGLQLKLKWDSSTVVFLWQMQSPVVVLNNEANFTGKKLCWSPFWIKYRSSVCNFIEKEILALFFLWFTEHLRTTAYSENFAWFLRTLIMWNTREQLLLTKLRLKIRKD